MSNKPQPVMGSVRQFWINKTPRDTFEDFEFYYAYTKERERSTHVLEAAPTLQLLDKLEEALTMGAFHHNACPWLNGKECCCANTKVVSALTELRKWKEGLK